MINSNQPRGWFSAVSLRFLPVLAIWVTLLSPDFSALHAQIGNEAQKKVLVFHLMRRDDAAVLANDRVYQKVLTDGLAGQIDYYSEHVDLARFGVTDYRRALRDFLKQKYKGTSFDLIIATTADMKDFLARYGAELFPHTPVVFSLGTDTTDRFDDLNVPPNFTGIVYGTDRRGTLDIIHRLQPAVRHVFVVSGASESVDKWHQARAQRQFKEDRNGFDLTYLSGLPMDDLKRRVSHLPRDSVVYFLIMAEDGAGQRFSTVDALDQIVAASSVPVYTWHDSYLGHGVVGGKLASSENVANQTAEMALRILHGESVETIPIARVDTSRLAFDWRQLQRWKLGEENLPAGSEVLFKEATLWERYRNRIIGVIALMVLQSALIAALLIERRRRYTATHGLKESEARYRNVVENQTELICRFLPDTTLTFVNEAYCRYFGKTARELIGTKALLLIPESERDSTLRYVESFIDNPRSETREHFVNRPDGVPGWQQWTSTVISSGTAGQMELQGVGRDISERKRLEQQLVRSERQFSTLVENSPDVICRLDRNLCFIYASPNFGGTFGFEAASFIGKRLAEATAPGYDWSGFESRCRETIERRQGTVHEFQYRGRYYRTRIIPEYASSGEVESLMTISEDFTARRRSELELERLTTRLFNLQDEERRRIARELHDGVAQSIFAITLNLHRAEKQVEPSSKAAGLISDSKQLAEQSLTELRTLSYLLHPPVLDQVGLAGALQWFARGFAERSGIQIETIDVQDIGRLSPDVETALFRIVQESLTNVRRHSGSDTASIQLERSNGEVRLQVLDRGRGMSERGANGSGDESTKLGVGIPGMRQRLVQLGGRLQIESTSNGTTITAVVPAGKAAALRQHSG
jgi:PAS domain S-box-containing protein